MRRMGQVARRHLPGNIGQGNRVKKGSSSFLKKKNQKLSRIWARSLRTGRSQNNQKFFAFFLKKEGLASGHRIHPITLPTSVRDTCACSPMWSKLPAFELESSMPWLISHRRVTPDIPLG
jgi:hypothetical protein